MRKSKAQPKTDIGQEWLHPDGECLNVGNIFVLGLKLSVGPVCSRCGCRYVLKGDSNAISKGK